MRAPARGFRSPRGDTSRGSTCQTSKAHKGAPIVIEGAAAGSPPLFEGGDEAWHLSRCAGVTLSANIAVRGQSDNGINVDDGGAAGSAHHIVLEKIHVSDIGRKGTTMRSSSPGWTTSWFATASFTAGAARRRTSSAATAA